VVEIPEEDIFRYNLKFDRCKIVSRPCNRVTTVVFDFWNIKDFNFWKSTEKFKEWVNRYIWAYLGFYPKYEHWYKTPEEALNGCYAALIRSGAIDIFDLWNAAIIHNNMGLNK